MYVHYDGRHLFVVQCKVYRRTSYKFTTIVSEMFHNKTRQCFGTARHICVTCDVHFACYLRFYLAL